ncbi:YcxB family protein [Xanthomonas campestris pv. phormiicola]|nr:YcxB family protein [Xanthomonas campestris pv. phormiicola]UYC17548.1 YcxB family protein [Xanthomonas campestris pv. phormiicola]
MISGIISVDDYLAAQRLHQRRPLRRALVLTATLLLAGVPLVIVGTSDAVCVVGGMLGGIGGGGLIGLALLYGWKLPRKLRRLHAQQAALRHAITYAWDETGLEVRWSGGQARRPWTDFIRYRESPQVLLLYHNDMLFDMVPTSWFADAAQREAFRRLAARVGSDAARAV